MSERITLRAKSDGTEISGELVEEYSPAWIVRLAKGVDANILHRSEWDRVHTLPTAPGCVFRATVCGVENVRVMVSDATDGAPYMAALRTVGYWHTAENIDPATVRIELEGDSEA